MDTLGDFRLISHLQWAVVTVEEIKLGRQPAFCETLLRHIRHRQVNEEREQHDESAEGKLLLAVAEVRKLKHGWQSE